MSKIRLSRRTLLRGIVGGGAAVAVGLPPLEIFFNRYGTAYAAGDAFPLRYGMFYWGNGVLPEKWIPATTGSEYALSEQLLPMAEVKNEFSLLTGYAVKTGNTSPHGSGPAGILSGGNTRSDAGEEADMAGPTLDQIIALEIGGDTRFRSIELGVQRGVKSMSYNSATSANPPETSPKALFDRVFSNGFVAPGETPILDPRLGLQRSVLDAVMDDVEKLNKRLGTVDKERLDQHLTGVRELEVRIARLEEDPPSLASCRRPDEPLPDFPDIEGRPQMTAISRAMADLVAYMLACDQTRVFTNVFSGPVSNVLYPETTSGHHQLTHDEPGEQPEVNVIVKLIMGEFAHFMKTLKSIPEGDATLLDHCLILGTSDVSYGRTHSIEEYPVILAGGANGRLRRGLHLRSASAENVCKVSLTVMQTMGLSRGEFGFNEGRTSETVGAVLV